MPKQPHIYTLPEQFMKDDTVPMHWKLYAIINGFWVSARPVFASNKFFSEKLGCSERYVRDCLEKLEQMGILDRVGKSQHRRIVPKGGAVSSAHDPKGGTSSSAGAEPAVPHISDSNSVRESRAAKAAVSFEVVEDEPKRPRAPKDRSALELRDTLYEMFKDATGVAPSVNGGDYQRVLAALKLLKAKDIEALVEDALQNRKPPVTVREALTDRAIDRYRQDNH